MESVHKQENVIATQDGFKILQIHLLMLTLVIPVLLDSGVIIVHVSFILLLHFICTFLEVNE